MTTPKPQQEPGRQFPTWHEASVTIDGVSLTDAEAMATRVAVSSMLMELGDPSRRRTLGEQIAEGYRRALDRVERLLVAGGGPG